MTTYSHDDLLKLFKFDVRLRVLKGYSVINKELDNAKRYSSAKQPVPDAHGKPMMIEDAIKEGDVDSIINSEEMKGIWLGLEIPKGYILVDIDHKETGKTVAECLLKAGKKFVFIETPNGYQYIFRDTGKVKNQTAKYITLCGVVADFRLHGKGYTVLPTPNTEGRRILWVPDTVENMPDLFIGVRTVKDGDADDLSLPIMEGGRNDALLRHTARVRAWIARYRLATDFKKVMDEINMIFCQPPLEDREMTNIYKSVDKLEMPEPVNVASDDSEVSLKECCELNYDAIIPRGFSVDGDKNLTYGKDKEFVSVCQSFAIAARVSPEGENDTLGFMARDSWGKEALISMNISERAVFEAEMTAFLEKPLDSGRMKLLQKYLAEYFHLNHRNLPVYHGLGRTGWLDEQLYIPTRANQDVLWTDENLTTAYTCRGSEAEQMQVLREVMKTPAFMVVLGALSATLVRQFNVPNPVIFVSGKKGTGKSTSTALAVSLFGNPKRLKATWFSTRVGKEGFIHMNSDMPIWIDEIETLGRNLDELINMIYQFESGIGKIRGKKSLRNQKALRLSGAMLITSEKDMDAVVSDVSSKRTTPMGVYRRTLEISADSDFFSQFNEGKKTSLTELNQFILQNYGWFGVRWVEHIEQNIVSIREAYNRNLKATSKLENMESTFALLLTALDVVRDMGVVDDAAKVELQRQIVRIASEHRDKNKQVEEIAYLFKMRLADYCSMNNRRFVGLAYQSDKSNGYDGTVDGEDVFIFKSVLDKLCKDNGWVQEHLLKDLKNREWLEISTGSGYQKQMRVLDKKPWGYKILGVLEKAEADNTVEHAKQYMERYSRN